MEIVAFTPAALLLATLASDYALTEDEACFVLRGLRTDHARGIIPVGAVERHVDAVLNEREAREQAAFGAGAAAMLARMGLKRA